MSADGGTSWDPDWTDISGSDADTTSHTVTGLANNTGYTFELRGVNEAGDGLASSVTATTRPGPSFASVPDNQVYTAGTATTA